ncbi:MAG: CNP1-like family protein [Burkholderiaceae bacterium]
MTSPNSLPRSAPALAALGAVLGVFVLLCPPPAAAQFADEGESTRPPATLSSPDQPPTMTMPEPMPPVPAFEAMTPFTSDGQTTMSFALDPASLLTGERHAQVTIAARSATGVLNVAYYGFDCERLTYRMLAYQGSDGQWQASKGAIRWRDVRDGETRNRQFREVYGAVCVLGGKAVADVPTMLERLKDPRRSYYVTY